MHRWGLPIEEPQAEALQIAAKRHPLWYAFASLAAATKVPPKPRQQMTVQAMEDPMWMTWAKIRLPSSEGLIDPSDQHRWRHSFPF